MSWSEPVKVELWCRCPSRGLSVPLWHRARLRWRADAGRGEGQGRGCGHRAVELAGDVSLEAAADLPLGLALGGAAGDVGAGGGVIAHAGDRDDVQGLVQR